MYRKFSNYILYFPANSFLLFVCREGLYLQLKYITGVNTGESKSDNRRMTARLQHITYAFPFPTSPPKKQTVGIKMYIFQTTKPDNDLA